MARLKGQPAKRERVSVEQQHDDALAHRHRIAAAGLLAGLTQREMGDQLGISRQEVQRICEAVRQEWAQETRLDVAALVDQELMKLRRLWRHAFAIAVNDRHPDQLQAIQTCLRISERVMRTLGIERHPLIEVNVELDTCDVAALEKFNKWMADIREEFQQPPIEGELAALPQPAPMDTAGTAGTVDPIPADAAPLPPRPIDGPRRRYEGDDDDRRRALAGAQVIGPDGSLREGQPSRVNRQLLPVEDPERPNWDRGLDDV